MFRRAVSGLLLGPALLLGSFAWSGYIALQTVFDETRSADIAQELLDNDAVRDQLADNVASALSAALPDAVPIEQSQIDAAALAILDDPRVSELIVGSLGQTHGAFLGTNDTPTTVDFGPVMGAASEQLAVVSPSAGEALASASGFSVELPTQRIPNASPIKSLLETAVPYLAGAALALAVLALVVARDRGVVFNKAGKWAIFTAAFYLVVGYGVPALLRLVVPAQAEIFAALVQAVLRTTLVPSMVMAGVGAAMLALSWVWPDPDAKGRPAAAAAPAPSQPTPARPSAPNAQVASHPNAVTMPAPVSQQAASWTPPPTTHIAPARPQAAAPPQQPVTPPATPVVPATPPSNPVVEIDEFPDPIVTGDASGSSLAPPPNLRPTLPTRAAPSEPPVRPMSRRAQSARDSDFTTGGTPKARPPRWAEGHGWVLDPNDPRPLPDGAVYVEGIGYVVPGAPPRQ